MSSADSSPGRTAPVALIDLGDTLCDCTPVLRVRLARMRQPGELERDETMLPLPPYLESRRRQVMSEPGFWRELPPRPAGFELLHVLCEFGFRVHVLTKGPHEAPQVWADKVAWCRAHLADVPVILTDDKSRVHGDVLVDDWPPYVESWLAQWPAGIAILPEQPWNATAALGPRCIRDDCRSRDVVVAALRGQLASAR